MEIIWSPFWMQRHQYPIGSNMRFFTIHFLWHFQKCGAYLLEKGTQNKLTVSGKILCIAFSLVKVCCKLLIISKYLILVLYFYFKNVFLPIECFVVNFGFMSVVFLLTWSSSKQDLQIDRCFKCAILLHKQQNKPDFIFVWIHFKW